MIYKFVYNNYISNLSRKNKQDDHPCKMFHMRKSDWWQISLLFGRSKKNIVHSVINFGADGDGNTLQAVFANRTEFSDNNNADVLRLTGLGTFNLYNFSNFLGGSDICGSKLDIITVEKPIIFPCISNKKNMYLSISSVKTNKKIS